MAYAPRRSFGPESMGFGQSLWGQCGCWYVVNTNGFPRREYMPQIDLAAHTTIMSITSKTVLTQTFVNSSPTQSIDQASYTFPLYDGVSIVGFTCRVGSRTIHGLVKEKQKARADYAEATSRGETAGLLEELPESSDVFTTRIGNIPANEKIVVKITYLGELKHDAEVDGVRFTIPTAIAPRYGTVSNNQAGLPSDSHLATDKGGMRITVDVSVDEGSFISGIQSPSHPIAVTLGRTSVMAEDSTDPHRASATLSQSSTELEKDFVLLVHAKGQDIPRALLETHPSFPNQRALMATLVPRFNLPPSRPEMVFVVDRSGSMDGKVPTVISALQVLLKSLPVGVKFNICSFGSKFSFLWPRSKSYDRSSLEEALQHVSAFAADFGGTEMLLPIVEIVKNRYKDMQLEVMLLTDGEIWDQHKLFNFINETVAKEPVRFFSLGIGASASHSLVEGIARAGNGFAQSVGENEKLDKKMVRMLKGALTPHIKDYTLEVKYEQSIEDDYELVEKVTEALKVLVTDPDSKDNAEAVAQKPTISLFDPSTKGEEEKKPISDQTGQDRYSHLPTVAPPKLLQAPSRIPPLYPFIRTSAYLLISPEACQNTPKSVILRATSEHGPLELEIPVQDIGKGRTIHQLAAKKAVTELEEGRGWIVDATGDDGKQLKDRFDGRWNEIIEREAVRLGVKFQVGGKWSSFVAVQKNNAQVEQEASEDMMLRTVPYVEGLLDYGSDSDGIEGFGMLAEDPQHEECGVSPDSSDTIEFACLTSAWQSAASPRAKMRASTGVQPRWNLNNSGTPKRKARPVSGSASAKQTNGLDCLRFGSAQFSSSPQFSYAPQFSCASPASQAPAAGASALFGGGSPSGGAQGLMSFGASQAPVSTLNFGGGSPSMGGMFLCMSQTPAFGSSAPFGGGSRSGDGSHGMSVGASQAPAAVYGSALFGSPMSVGASQAPAGSYGSTLFGSPMSVDASQAPAADGFAQFGGAPPLRSPPSSQGWDLFSGAFPLSDDATVASLQKTPRLDTPEDSMHALIALQTFDGSWAWSDDLLRVLGLKEEDVADLQGENDTMATLLAIEFLERMVPEEKESWELVVEKARGWLSDKGNVEVEIQRRVAAVFGKRGKVTGSREWSKPV